VKQPVWSMRSRRTLVWASNGCPSMVAGALSRARQACIGWWAPQAVCGRYSLEMKTKRSIWAWSSAKVPAGGLSGGPGHYRKSKDSLTRWCDTVHGVSTRELTLEDVDPYADVLGRVKIRLDRAGEIILHAQQGRGSGGSQVLAGRLRGLR
jgi:hypothetical protein